MEPKQACNKHVKLSLITNAAQLAQAINVLRRTQVKTIALEDSSTPRQSTFFFFIIFPLLFFFFFRYLSSSFKNIGPLLLTFGYCKIVCLIIQHSLFMAIS